MDGLVLYDAATADLALRLLAAAALGALVGLERELGAQQAGFRTHLLVALGAALFTAAGTTVAGADATRVAAQVVTGIGFLGAGAILRDGVSVKGLTTAASLWLTAAVGLACGLGRVDLAVVTALLGLLALAGLKLLEHRFLPRRRGRVVVLDVARGHDLADVVRRVEQVLGARVEVRAVVPGGTDRDRLELRAHLAAGYALVDLAQRLGAVDGVCGVELSV